jgi:hypothetical protein
MLQDFIWTIPLSEFTSHTVTDVVDSAFLAWIGETLHTLPYPQFSFETNTFEPLDRSCLETCRRRFGWFNSPVCRTHPSLDQLLPSLTKKRRDRLKNTLAHASFQLGDTTATTTISDSQIGLIRGWLIQRWGPEAPSALLQFWWAVAAEDTLWVWLVDGVERVAVAYFVRRDSNCFIFQGNAHVRANVGAALLTAASMHLNSRGVCYLDPTCRTMFDKYTSDIYKRAIVNEDRRRPVLRATLRPPARPPEIPFWHLEWHEQETLLFEGI